MLISEVVTYIRRRQGHTSAAARSGATVLCMSANEADRVRREFKCDARSITDPQKLAGRDGPAVVDVSALYTLESDARRWLEAARERAEQAENGEASARARIAELEAEVERLRAIAEQARDVIWAYDRADGWRDEMDLLDDAVRGWCGCLGSENDHDSRCKFAQYAATPEGGRDDG